MNGCRQRYKKVWKSPLYLEEKHNGDQNTVIYLQNSFGETSLLCELFEVFSIRVVVDTEVRLHCA